MSALFSLILGQAIREADITRSELVYHKKHQYSAYADNLVLLTTTIRTKRKESCKKRNMTERKNLKITKKRGNRSSYIFGN